MRKIQAIDHESVAANNPQIDRKLLEEYRALKESLSKDTERLPMGATYRLRGPMDERFSGFYRLGASIGMRRAAHGK